MLKKIQNHSRALLQRALQSQKPSDKTVGNIIKRGRDLEKLIESPGWRQIEKFMDSAREGTHAYMERDVHNVKAFTFASLFGTYLRYLAFLFEIRAYNKIRTYVAVSIANGRKFAEQQQRAEQNAKRGS